MVPFDVPRTTATPGQDKGFRSTQRHRTRPRQAGPSCPTTCPNRSSGEPPAIDALRKFVDEVTPMIDDQSRRKTVIEPP